MFLSVCLDDFCLGSHLFGMSCSFGQPCVLFGLLVVLAASHFGCEDRTLVLIASVLGNFLPFNSKICIVKSKSRHMSVPILTWFSIIV